MDTSDRREILSRVAAGTITPEEAAAQLESAGQAQPQPAGRIRLVRVIKQLGPAEIIGDPTVREAIADGPHRARIDGDVMVIEGESSDEPGGFIFGFGRNLGSDRLLVRMNPSLPLDLQVQAGSCRVQGLKAEIRAEVQAGSASIDGFGKSFDLSVQAGSVRATGRLDEGDCRIGCDAGSVNLHLEHGSSVRIQARASMGKVTLPAGEVVAGVDGGRDVTIGHGRASLRIEANLGSVNVSADR
jgi:hypothetical protein